MKRVGKLHTAKKRPSLAARPKPASNETLLFEQRQALHALEIRQVELELQNRALREAQSVLEESRARYADLYDYAPVGQLTLDRFGLIKELNLAAAALVGKERRSLVDAPFRLFIEPESFAAFSAHLDEVFSRRRFARVELTLRRPGGARRTIELLSVPPGPEGSAPLGAPATLHAALIDVSAIKDGDRRPEVEPQEEPEARPAGVSVHQVGRDFLAMVSHDLRSPLAPMLLWVRALRTGGMSDGLRERAVDALESCINVQTKMIDDLIDVARGQSGDLRLERQRLDLQTVVNASVETSAPAVASRQIRLTFETEPEPVWVMGDPTRLGQIVSNLLSNAIKLTKEGGRIDLSLRAQDGEAMLVLRNDGEDVEGPRLAGLFEPRVHGSTATTRRDVDLGLGLMMVRQLLAHHGGKIAAERVGTRRGVCFTVTLPRHLD
jgi:signal transduction histidine kinase